MCDFKPGQLTDAVLLRSFLSRVEYDTNGGCWLWSGETYARDYGRVNVRGLKRATHLAALIYRGERPEWRVLMHSCDVPACVNPDHLRFGTQSENIKDAYRRGRAHGRPPALRGSANPASKITERDRADIRARRSRGETLTAIAADYPISFQAVHGIVKQGAA